MKIRPVLRDFVRKDYGDESQTAESDIIDCALGINAFGTSAGVVKTAQTFDYSRLAFPPETGYKRLKKRIVEFWAAYSDLKTENIKVANGSSVVLSRINKIFIEPGARVLGYVPQFPEYMREVAVLGGVYESVHLSHETGLKFDVEAFLRAMGKDHSIVYIDNPNNPTGQHIDIAGIEIIVREAEKKEIAVIVDEAYGDYIEEKLSAISLRGRYKNLIVTRTFSKGYGIGATRIGYAVMSSELSPYYNKIELPFPVSTFGSALAEAALSDQAFLLDLRIRVQAAKRRLTGKLRGRGYAIAETHEACPIFVATHMDKAMNLDALFLSKKIMTTPGEEFQNLDKCCVRINTPACVDDFLIRVGP